ncbi:hypothetical protein psyc5s11_37750 [Clostridium gelidum]|uniref:Beta-lactamase-related domain-containing protein n=1 Tax=Clostridium gelidum TaxID=704125 RepID=A0ABM7T9B2_9CLOT|nr:serine hydrolase domain-containing protein [Clostridium gelidum]BCZ47708.1 hypothetical protein psyc5s11_37750 [Clostridium gelidum]
MKYKKIILTCIILSTVASSIIFFSNLSLKRVSAVNGQSEVGIINNNNNSNNDENNASYNDKNNGSNYEKKLYGIGSVSKVYTTVAVMKLVDEGKIKLDDRVLKYIPEFKMADERYKDITIRMLLNHSSGINGGTLCNAMLLGDNSTYNHDNLLANLKDQKLKAAPGEYSVYCNDGFTLAEIVVERVSGMSFTEYLEKEISIPLGLSNTKTPQSNIDKDRLEKIYFNKSSLELPYDCANVIGSGGIYSTAEDMCNFSKILMNSNNGFLSTTSINAMGNPESDKNVYGVINGDGAFKYGLGWDSVNTYPFNKYNIKAISKGGDTNYFHGNLTVLPDNNMSAAVLSSGGSSSFDKLVAQELLEAALEAKGVINETSEYAPVYGHVNKNIPEEIKENAGVYSGNKMLKVTFNDDNKLIISTVDDEINVTHEYVYTDEGYFISTNGNYISETGLVSAQNGSIGSTKLYFSKESNGKTYIFIQSYESYPGLSHTAMAIPYVQKIEENPVSKEVLDVWKKRNNKKYYLISEKYTSTYYLIKDRIGIKINLSDTMNGYLKNYGSFRNNKIINENYCEDFIKIPGMIGRDTNDFSFYKKDNIEYLKLPTTMQQFICEDAIEELNLLDEKIEMDKSNAKWFDISKDDEGKLINIEIIGKGSYSVYDKYDNCVDTSSIKNKDNKILLPNQGKIAFVGEEGTEFKFN